MVKMPSEVE